jgi:hypothetical protein
LVLSPGLSTGLSTGLRSGLRSGFTTFSWALGRLEICQTQPPKDQPKIADANQGAANSGDNSGLKFEGYKVPLTSDQKMASAGTRELGLSNFSNMDDHLKNLKMAQVASPEGKNKWQR